MRRLCRRIVTPVIGVLAAPLLGAATSIGVASEGLSLILRGLFGCAFWLVVLAVEVVLAGMLIYFATRGLLGLGIELVNRYS